MLKEDCKSVSLVHRSKMLYCQPLCVFTATVGGPGIGLEITWQWSANSHREDKQTNMWSCGHQGSGTSGRSMCQMAESHYWVPSIKVGFRPLSLNWGSGISAIRCWSEQTLRRRNADSRNSVFHAHFMILHLGSMSGHEEHLHMLYSLLMPGSRAQAW